MERRKNVGLNFHKTSDHEDSRKVIVRTFDMPTKTSKGHFNLTTLRGLPTDKERWRYQFSLEGTSESNQSELHVKPNVTRVYPGRKVTGKVSTVNSSVAASIPPNQNVISKIVPENGVVVMAPKTIVPKETSPITEKIVLNNLPESVVGNSIRIVDSKEVDGKKIFYFKALKNVNQTVPKLETSNVKPRSSYQFKLDELQKRISESNKQISSISSCLTSNSPVVRVNKSQVVSPLKISPPNKVSNTSPVCVSSRDSGGKSEVVVESVVECGRTLPSSFSLANGFKLQTSSGGIKKPFIVVNPKLVPLSSEITNASNVCQSFVKDKGIVTQLVTDTIPNVNGSRENEKGSLCFEVLRPKETVSTNMILKPIESRHVLDASNLKRKFVQADSTTPCPSQIPEDTEAVGGKQLKFNESILKPISVNKVAAEIPYEALALNKNCMNVVVLQPGNDILDKAVSLNKKPSSDSKIPLVPKHNLMNTELLRKRQQIALQFQQETKKAKVLPRILRTIRQPSKTFQQADMCTQTSLFSLVEPGRMVEMFVDSSVNGSSDSISSIQDFGPMTDMPESTLETVNFDSAKRRRMDLQSNSLTSFSEGTNTSSIIVNNDQTEVLDGLSDHQHQNNIAGKPQSIEEKLNSAFRILANKNFNPLQSSSDVLLSEPSRNNVIKKLEQTLWKHYWGCLIADDDGNLPIHNAIMDEDIKEVKKQCRLLKARKQSLDVKNLEEETPLILAVQYENLEIVKELIKFGADPSVQDKDGNTVLHLVLNEGDLPTFEIIMKNVEDYSSVLNQTNDEGFCPLHLCAIKNKVSEAAILANKGANINERDRKSGRTPLFHAVEGNHHKVARVLIDMGASTTVPNFNGQIPLNASELNLAVDFTNHSDGEELHASLLEKESETIKQTNLKENSKTSQNDKSDRSSRASTKDVPIADKSDQYLIRIKSNSDVNNRSKPTKNRESLLALNTISRTNRTLESHLTLNSINSLKSNPKTTETLPWSGSLQNLFDYNST